jgi:hypothetical protein
MVVSSAGIDVLRLRLPTPMSMNAGHPSMELVRNGVMSCPALPHL